MKFSLINLIFIALIFSQNSMAVTYPEPPVYTVETAKDYYRKSYGYNTQTPCSGDMCLPVGTRVACKYSYSKGGADTKVQICKMQSITDANGIVTDVAKKKYNMVTGIINSNGDFSATLPQNELLLATDWRIKNFVASPAKGMSMDELTATFAGACPPGLECPTPDPCEKEGAIGTLGCFKEEALSYEYLGITPFAVGPPDFDPKAIGEAYKKMGYAALCSNFISADGSYGAWGELVIKTFKEVCNDCFFGENSIDVEALCPNFKKFSQARKEYFWVWTMGSMAFLESSCKTRVRVRGTRVKGHQEYAVGIIQLEESRSRRKTRGPECSAKPGQELYDLSFQFACGASIIRDTRWQVGKPLWGNVTRYDQYWQKLRSIVGKNGKMSQNISHFPGCK